MADEFPPLRIRDADGSPDVLPVFSVILSDNLSVVRRGPGEVALTVSTGGGGAGATYAATGNQYLTMAAAADLTAERILQAGTGLILFNLGANDSAGFALIVPVSATSGGTGLSSYSAGQLVYAAAANPAALTRLDSAAALNVLVSGASPSWDKVGAGHVNTSLVTSARTLTFLYPLTGGGDLSADRTQSVDTAFLVTSARTISAGAGLSGGGNLGADRTISLVTPVSVASGGIGAATLTAFGILYGSGASAVQATSAPNLGQLMVGSGLNQAPIVVKSGTTGQRLISSGGAIGNLAWINTAAVGAAVDNSYVVVGLAGDLTAERVLTGSTGLTLTDGGANGNAELSVNTNVRDKIFAFFVAGNMTTAMLAEETRIYIPFNMSALRVQTAVTTSNAGAALLVQLSQFGTPVAVANTMFTAGSRPSIPVAFSAGSATAFDQGTLFAGSYLGIAVDQVGSTVAGSNLTVTVIARGS